MARARFVPRLTAVRAGTALLLGLGLATLTLVTEPEQPLLLWLAAVYVWSLAALVLMDLVAARRAVREEEDRLRQRAGVPARALADRAVREERQRLAVDIRGVLVDTLTQVRDGAMAALSDGGGRTEAWDRQVGALRTRTQVATSELRRLLGILRVAEETDPVVGDGDGDADGTTVGRHGATRRGPGADAAHRSWRPPRRDVVETVAIVLLGAFEAWLNTSTRQGAVDPAVVLVTVLAAAAFLGVTTAPVLTAVVQSLVFAVGFWLGAPVMSGVWMVRGVGVVLWRTAARTPGRAELGAALLLATTVLATRGQEPALGVVATVAVVVVALAGGLLRAVTLRRSAATAAAAREVQSRTDREVARAVTAERVRVARELHDVVSHSVGLISMQLNVLEVAPTPAARDRALRDVVATSEEALRELTPLDRFPEMPAPGPRTVADVEALVARVRATGGTVELTVLGEPPPARMDVVYRVLQEALTNAMQHAPGADVRVRVRSTAEGTWLLVHDDGPGPGGRSDRRYGMVGLRERVALAGGTLEAGGDTDRGGFRVEAFLPALPGAARTEEVGG
ncbi:histidine kinase [Ornithinimicrobium sp. W1665]|uniref:sensor histidine kinase n=1 Tax=Ornithinimicrobium sp. W1665 TaxID=3416666 RepID=UPI003CEE9C7F